MTMILLVSWTDTDVTLKSVTERDRDRDLFVTSSVRFSECLVN